MAFGPIKSVGGIYVSAVALSAFAVVLLATRRVSVGSLAAAACLPIAVWITTDSAVLIAVGGVFALFIFIRHRDNLKRLAAGTEPKFRFKKDQSSRTVSRK
jgi:glycerol-3-phosphate acyltransferase PlsY